MFIKKGVVIPVGDVGDVDDVYAFTPSILEVNNKIYCYYSSYDGSSYRIALAISKDGVNFIKKGIVIGLGDIGEIDDSAVWTPTVIKINNKIYCYYCAFDGSNYRIALAISKDGVNFIKKGVILDIGSAEEVDDSYIYLPHIIRINNKFYLYYIASDGTHERMALAISTNGFNFIKKGIVLDVGDTSEVDEWNITGQSILNINNKYYNYYISFDGTYYRIALAVGGEGMNFIKRGIVIPLGNTGEVDDYSLYKASILMKNNKIYSYYSTDDGTLRRIALAISENAV